MPNKKISQLTPKGSALAGTDLLEVSVFNGATYDTKSLTGANVVSGLQPTLFSGTNIKTINSTSLLGSGDIAISTGLTVGTTPITSGTVGRVLFQGTGNVVQQDANFAFDSTLKRLTLKAVGTTATDIPLVVRNSADTLNFLEIRGDNQFLFTNNSSGVTLPFTIRSTDNNSAPYIRAISNGDISEASLIATRTGGSGVSATGINRGFLQLANGGGNLNVLSSNGGFAFSAQPVSGYNPTSDQMRLISGNLSIGTGYTGTARLDIKAQGALSTDIALRVRNSADSANLFSVQGDGVSNVLTRFNCGFSGMTTTGGALHVYAGNSNDFMSRWFNTAGTGVISIRTVSNGGQLIISDNTGTAGLTLDGQNSNALTFGAGRNIYFDTATGTKIGATTSQKFAFWNATPIVQPTTAVAAATVVSGAGGNVKHDDTFDGYTVEQVVRALRNTGILA